MPDEHTGERACAVMVPIITLGSAVDSLRRYTKIRRGMAQFKVPEQIGIWDVLPTNDAGKAAKHQIRTTLM
ncbi:hypothetical protein [Mycobacterium leprae]|nr:hypothetical protein A8144_07730 [Mycobacterium leprae 3125609]OAX71263.1 hypothetical protein A3216_06945 [Mycobacterium leprae 7935681]